MRFYLLPMFQRGLKIGLDFPVLILTPIPNFSMYDKLMIIPVYYNIKMEQTILDILMEQ